MAQSAANRVYQDFEPFFEWAEDEGSATLTLMLPGFRRDQLKVQVTSTPVLRISGERQVIQNVWRRFAKEFSIPPYCDASEVSAKFEGGMLHVKFPKLSKPQKEEEEGKKEEQKVAPTIPQQPKAEDNDQQKSQQQKDQQEPISDEKEKKSKEAEPNEAVAGGDDDKKVRTSELSKAEESEASKDQEIRKEEKEPIGDEKDKSKEAAPSEVRTNDELSKTNERKGAKMAQRLKTRLVDFTLSFTPSDDKDNVDQQGYGGNLVTGVIKRPKAKILLNIVVAVLLIMVIWTFVKNAFRSSSSSQGGSEFQEF